jgi:PAS domain S-box-containing protein
MQVEIFISRTLQMAKAPKIVATISSNPQLRKYFFAFVRDECDQKVDVRTQFQYWKDIEDAILRHALSEEKTSNFLPPSAHVTKLARLGIDLDYKEVNNIEDILANSADRNIFVIMLMRLASEFLRSKHYLLWRAEASADIMEVMSNTNVNTLNSSDAKDHTLKWSHNTARSIDANEIPRILNTSSWLFTMIASMEDNPVCFTLASASPERQGFPLIYVNKAFERMTGYDRSECVGTNCKFLQSRQAVKYSECEKDHLKLMSNRLAEALPVRTVVSNYKKNGEKFTNLLVMKPLFDQNGTYRYVVALQTEICSSPGGYILREEFQGTVLTELSMSQKLIALIPDIIYCDSHD